VSSIASLINRAGEVPAARDGLAAGFRGFYEWMTEAEVLLFPKAPLVFIGIVHGAEAMATLGCET
jgi:hypothetical protein